MKIMRMKPGVGKIELGKHVTIDGDISVEQFESYVEKHPSLKDAMVEVIIPDEKPAKPGKPSAE